jgi:uncharacterized RDD family membrane protein YckC
MKCEYCGSDNETSEIRCGRCGRRLTAPGPILVPEAYGNTAPKIDALSERLLREDTRSRAPMQGRLFPTQEPKRVIPFESISPEAAKFARSTQERNAKTRSKQRYQEHLGVDGEAPEEVQRELGFPEERQIPQLVERVVYTKAQVAAPAHRAMAAAYDIAMVLLAVGVLMLMHYLAGAPFESSRLGIGTYIGLVICVGLFYKLLWAVGNGDTPGMAAVKLRLINFDGMKPTQRERVTRLLVSLVSLASLCVGILWCLFDEEKLTWHDHITKTFPSPAVED